MIDRIKDFLFQEEKPLTKEDLLHENEMYLHEKRVEISKLTPVKWKKLFGTIDTLPGIVAQVIMSSGTDNYFATILTALDLALDEVIVVVALLADVDEDYINENVGIDEIIEYLKRTVELNRLDTAVKNVKSLLPNQ